MACCKEFTVTVGEGCPPPIMDDTVALTVASPIAPHRPGCFSKSYTLHVTAGTFLSIRLMGSNFSSGGGGFSPACDQCDTYLYLVNSGGVVVAENDDAAMGLGSHLIVLVEVEDDYTIECTTFSAGVTGTIRTTVNDKCMSIGWAGNSANAATGTFQPMTAPQSLAPLTWAIVNGSLPFGVSLASDFNNPVQGELLFGQTDEFSIHAFRLRITDSNSVIREQLFNLKAIAFQGYRVFPTFILAPPVGTPFTYQMVPIGGVPPYAFYDHAVSNPTGITFDPLTGTFSGIATGANIPSSSTYYIVDSQGDYSSVGISWVTCTGQNPVSALVWTVSPITPIPPGDSVSGAIAGGDGVFDIVNIYPGVGPCVSDPTRVQLTAQLCNPTHADYDINMTVRMTGTIGNSPACPAIGEVQLDVQGMGFFPPVSVPGTGGQIYDFTTQVLTATVPTGGVVNISILASVTYADAHVVVTLRPLAPP